MPSFCCFSSSNRIEEEMRENHPFFDSPLFFVGRDSTLRRWCLRIVEAKYRSAAEEAGNGSFRGQGGGQQQTTIGANNGRRPMAAVNTLNFARFCEENGRLLQPHKYKQLHSLLGLLTYLDWTMVLVTAFSCGAMLFESPWPIDGDNMVFKNPYLEANTTIGANFAKCQCLSGLRLCVRAGHDRGAGPEGGCARPLLHAERRGPRRGRLHDPVHLRQLRLVPGLDAGPRGGELAGPDAHDLPGHG
jgi:hypothetical protein